MNCETCGKTMKKTNTFTVDGKIYDTYECKCGNIKSIHIGNVIKK